MHFCVSATRGGFHKGFCCPRKIGTNWFIPALVKRRFGASGNSGDDGTIVCCFSRKKSRNDCLISAKVMVLLLASLSTANVPNGIFICSRHLRDCLPESIESLQSLWQIAPYPQIGAKWDF